MRKKSSDYLEEIFPSGRWRQYLPQPLVTELSPLLTQIKDVHPPKLQRTLREEFNGVIRSFIGIQSTINGIAETVQPGNTKILSLKELQGAVGALPNGLNKRLSPALEKLTDHFRHERERADLLKARITASIPAVDADGVVANVEGQVEALISDSDAGNIVTLTEQIEAAEAKLAGLTARVKSETGTVKRLEQEEERRRGTNEGLRMEIAESATRLAALRRLERTREAGLEPGAKDKATVIPLSDRAFIEDSAIGIVPLLGYKPGGSGEKFIEPGGDELLEGDSIIADALQRQRNGVFVFLKSFFKVTKYNEIKREKPNAYITTTFSIPKSDKAEKLFTEMPQMTVRFSFVPGVLDSDFEVEIEASTSGKSLEPIRPDGSNRKSAWNFELADPSKPEEIDPLVHDSIQQAAQKIFEKFRQHRVSLLRVDQKRPGPADESFLRDLRIDPE